jgi:hypothetical protein
MRCIRCGFESENTPRFCPNCGYELNPTPPGWDNAPNIPTAPPVPENPAADAILKVLRSNLFLVICILISVGALMSMAAGGGVPVVQILLAVFLWLTYSQAYKGAADAAHLRCVSGTVYAQYVITYVAAGLVALCGLIFAAAVTMIADSPELYNEILTGMQLDPDVEAIVSGILTGMPGTVVMVIFLVVAVLMVVINIFSLRYIHRFAKSVYRSILDRRLTLDSANIARTWLFVMGGFSAVSALSALAEGTIAAGISGGCTAAAEILAGILIGQLLTPAAPGATPEF